MNKSEREKAWEREALAWQQTAVKTEQDFEDLKNKESLKALAARYGKEYPQIIARSQEWLAQNTPIERARGEVLDLITGKQLPVSAPSPNTLGMDKREKREFSLAKVLAYSSNLLEKSKLGIELDCHSELLSRMRPEQRGKIRGLLIPSDIFSSPPQKSWVESRAPYAVGSNPTGGYAVQTDVLADNFVESLRPKSVCLMLGATVLSGLQGNVAIPSRSTFSDVFWLEEGGELSESESTFGQILLKPKTFGTFSRYSRLMLLQSTPQIEQLIRTDFAGSMATGLDKAILSGTGADNQPTGILNHPDVTTLGLAGANGEALSYESLCDMEYLAASANGLNQSYAWVGNSAIRKALRTTPLQSSGQEGNFIWHHISEEMIKAGYDSSVLGMALGYLFATTENIPSNFEKGTSDNLSGLIFGNWKDVLVGQWGVLEILSNPYGASDFASGSVSVRALQSVDLGIRNPEAFVICKQFSS
jgi:HK97 family phage major capsid protein